MQPRGLKCKRAFEARLGDKVHVFELVGRKDETRVSGDEKWRGVDSRVPSMAQLLQGSPSVVRSHLHLLFLHWSQAGGGM